MLDYRGPIALWLKDGGPSYSLLCMGYTHTQCTLRVNYFKCFTMQCMKLVSVYIY